MLRGRRAAKVACATLTLSFLTLGGCSNPYALNINKLNYDAPQAASVIQFTDPKLFPREHLINERREELVFLEAQRLVCNTAEVKPEIIRELEVVRSIAASVGLKFDPAAAANFNAETEFAQLKNDIARTQLEMQLAQLKRDAELLTDKLAAQETVANGGGTPSGQPAATTVSGGITAPSAADIKTLTDNVGVLIGKLQTASRADIPALKNKGGTASPIDTFNYRKACRDTVKSAINQTRLDELHDMDGNALVRLQLRATVLPGAKGYNDTLGILRMEVVPPVFGSAQSPLVVEIYRNWLEYVNQNINLLPMNDDRALKDQRIRTASSVFAALSDYAQLRYLEIPKYKLNGDFISEGAKICSGLQRTERKPADCWYPRIVLPPSYADGLDIQLQAADAVADQLLGAAQGIRKASVSMGENCNLSLLDSTKPFKLLSDPNQDGKSARAAVITALRIETTRPFVMTLPATIRDSLNRGSNAEHIIFAMQQVSEKFIAENMTLFSAANEVLDVVGAKNSKCDISSFVPDAFFKAILGASQRVAVYDVAPAERVQPISTAARAADAIALAASLSGTLPTQGLGGSGNFAFSRSAIGKADALELAPIVVGFTEPVQVVNSTNTIADSLSAFGWLLGPKAVLEPDKQQLTLVHPVKPYDLYADLSLPGWWPQFKLKTDTAWAPNWRKVDSSGAVLGTTMDITGKTLARTVEVPMHLNAGDMEGLTTLLLKASNLPRLGAPRITRVEPSTVSACAGIIDFQIWGDNIWRTSMIHLGGRAVNTNHLVTASDGATTEISSIRVLPDMRGVVASVDISKIPNRRGHGSVLTVWTPDGRDATPITVSNALQSDGKCTRADADIPPPTKRPSIKNITPAQVSVCAPKVSMIVEGANLGEPLEASFGGVATSPPVALAPGDGTMAQFEINMAASRASFVGLTTTTVAIRTAKGLSSISIHLVGDAANCK